MHFLEQARAFASSARRAVVLRRGGLVGCLGDVDHMRFVASTLSTQQIRQLPMSRNKGRIERDRASYQRFSPIIIAPEHPGKLPQHGAVGDQSIHVRGLQGECFLYRAMGAVHEKYRAKVVFAGFQFAPERAEKRELRSRILGKSRDGFLRGSHR